MDTIITKWTDVNYPICNNSSFPSLEYREYKIIDSSSEKRNTLIKGFQSPVESPMVNATPNVCPVFIIYSHNYFGQIKSMTDSIGFDEYFIFDGTTPLYNQKSK